MNLCRGLRRILALSCSSSICCGSLSQYVPCLSLLILASASLRAAPTLRDEWVDADTGHRVVRLSRLPGTSESFYFHQNAFTAEGDKMVFANTLPGAGSRLFALDWATRKCEPLTEPGVRGGVVGRGS